MDDLISPFAVTDTLSTYSRIAQIKLSHLEKFRDGYASELDLTLGDIEVFATIVNYYMEKL